MKANQDLRNIRGVLFDKDGTLVDILKTWVPAVKAAAEKLEELTGHAGLAETALANTGFDFTNDSFFPDSMLAAHSNLDLITNWVGDHGDQELIATMQQVLSEEGIKHITPLFDLQPLFRHLKRQQFHTGIATMDDEHIAVKTVEQFGISKHIDFIAGFDSGYGEKPQPGMIKAFCRQQNLQPEEIAMVGDTNHDLAMGKNAGAGLIVGVLSGTNQREHLEVLADIVLNDARELMSLLG